MQNKTTGADRTGVLDEAYERLHQTGPEFEGWLSNHGPMATEALIRMGHGGQVHSWLDGYLPRLEELPRPTAPVFVTGDFNDRRRPFCALTRLGMRAANGRGQGRSCRPPPHAQIDWIFGPGDVSFGRYTSSRDALVRKTTDPPVVLAHVRG